MTHCPACGKPLLRPLAHCLGRQAQLCILDNCHLVGLCDACEFEWTAGCPVAEHHKPRVV